MKITIIDGNSLSDNKEFIDFSLKIKKIINNSSHNLEYFNLQSLSIKPCTGCWYCWWKTPGICSIKDDMEEILKQVLKSDLIIFITPLIMGFPSALIKKCLDRFIPLFHPYIEIHNGECHHLWRYDKYPAMASIFQELDDTLENDFNISKAYMKRTADHFRIPHHFCMTIKNSDKEIYNAINSI